MSHELRTPLNAIGGYAQLIELGLRSAATADQRADLERIQRSQRHLLSVINEVLNYARLESGAVAYDVRPMTVADVVATRTATSSPDSATSPGPRRRGPSSRRSASSRTPTRRPWGDLAAGTDSNVTRGETFVPAATSSAPLVRAADNPGWDRSEPIRALLSR